MKRRKALFQLKETIFGAFMRTDMVTLCNKLLQYFQCLSSNTWPAARFTR
jgi:hypothetical protein